MAIHGRMLHAAIFRVVRLHGLKLARSLARTCSIRAVASACELCWHLQEDASTFKSAMTSLSHVVMAAASTALTAEARAAASANIDMEEYATVLCQAMASYGELHLDCLASDEARSAFLHQVPLM